MAIFLSGSPCLVFLLVTFVNGEEIDNKLISLPEVECANGAITFHFETENSFNGRVYVRGLEDLTKCSKRLIPESDSFDQSNRTKFSLSIKRGECNMEKQRAEEGVAYSIVVIVGFHKAFETKNDAAFRGICFFREVRKIAGFLRGIAGSMSVVNENNGPTPVQPFSAQCTYTIRGETVDSPIVRYSKIGDTLHHVWGCSITNQRKKREPKPETSLGLLVHSCRVTDGRGGEFALLNENGCPLDEKIGMPSLEYDNATANGSSTIFRAYARISSYKFSQTTELRFRCTVAIYDDRQAQSDTAARPNCEAGIQNQQLALWKVLDVAVDMHVLDTFDEQLGDAGAPVNFLQRLNANADANSGGRCLAARCTTRK